MRRRTSLFTTTSPSSSTFTYTQGRTLTVKGRTCTAAVDSTTDPHVRDLFTDEILFFKRVSTLSLYESSLLTRVGTHIPWPGHMIYRVHTAASSSVMVRPHHRMQRHDVDSQGRGTREKRRRRRQQQGMKLYITDASSGGKVLYTMRRIKRHDHKWMMKTVSSVCSFFKAYIGKQHNYRSDDDDCAVRERKRSTEVEEIAVWKGASTTGRPYLILSGSLDDMTFDILTTTTTTTTPSHNQEQERREKRKRKRSIVGVVSKHLFDMDTKLHDAGRYGVYVQAGYDCALFVLLSIIVDELFHDDEDEDDMSMIPAGHEESVGGGVGSEAEPGHNDSGIREEKGKENEKEREGCGSLVSGGGGEEGKGGLTLVSDLGLGEQIVGSWSHADSLSDEEDRIRNEALMLEEHLTDSSDAGV